MNLQDLKILRDELEKLNNGFRSQHDFKTRLKMIADFRRILAELKVRAREAEVVLR